VTTAKKLVGLIIDVVKINRLFQHRVVEDTSIDDIAQQSIDTCVDSAADCAADTQLKQRVPWGMQGAADLSRQGSVLKRNPSPFSDFFIWVADTAGHDVVTLEVTPKDVNNQALIIMRQIHRTHVRHARIVCSSVDAGLFA
jgi:hypothetical protein